MHEIHYAVYHYVGFSRTRTGFYYHVLSSRLVLDQILRKIEPLICLFQFLKAFDISIYAFSIYDNGFYITWI